MIEQKFPQELNFPNIVPKGFPTIFKQWQLDPISGNKVWDNKDIVRFLFMNQGSGVFDPYRSYIQFTVSTNSVNNPVGGLQIDSSGQSFIEQTVLYSDNKQIQRITHYSVLAAYLADVGLNQWITQGRQAQGLGYGSFDTMPFSKANNNMSSSIKRAPTGAGQNALITYSTGLTFPTIGNGWGQVAYNAVQNSGYNCSKTAKGHVTNSNPLWSNQANGGSLNPTLNQTQASINYVGYANNIRGQYNTKFIQNRFPEHTNAIPLYQLQVTSNVSGGVYPFNYNPNKPYTTKCVNNWSDAVQFDDKSYLQDHSLVCANFGFNSLFTPFHTRGTFQPMISATIPQLMMQNGTYLPTKIPQQRRKFKVPLLSAVIGALIQSSNFFLIPLASINQCLLQITLDPYAMFTTGYSDYCQTDNIGMNVMQQRSYVIQRIRYNIQTYHFVSQQIQKYIQNSLVRQITTVSHFWQMSNQYQIASGQGVNNSYIVGCNSTHLMTAVCLFVSNDYQKYSFCRKHFRLSNNITKFWSKLAVQYWPPQPYLGNGGNVALYSTDDDNSVFVENIYWQHGYMFSRSPLPRINSYNFAVNDRPYNPQNTNTFYDPAMLGNHNYAWTELSTNADTAMGMPYIHQNRVVGRAAYIISYTPFSSSDHILQGINVSGLSNFEMVFQSYPQNQYQRQQTLYIFCKTAGVVKYGKKSIQTFR